jgi:pyruvate dehydrogenase E2 component (dihydrolipoamide acetyltransferase)
VARRIAAEHALDLSQLKGSGPLGRIQLADVQQRIAAGAVGAAGAAAQAPAAPGLPPMRRALVRAMALSNATVPQFQVERALDCGGLQALRTQFNAGAPADSPKLSINDFLLQAITRTLIEQPEMNCTFEGDVNSPDGRLVPARGAHIGLVVAVEGGLLVPVIHDAELLSLHELARRREDCVVRALSGRLRREELEGATFSISNLGRNGPDRFTAMINPPQSAILAVGRQRACVVAQGGKPVVRPQSVLTLTVDHRVADGRLAAQFLARLVEILEGRDWRAV